MNTEKQGNNLKLNRKLLKDEVVKLQLVFWLSFVRGF